MKSIKQTYRIQAPVSRVWHALADPAVIESWGGGPVKMDDHVGTRFELWGGDIYGVNTEVVKEKKLAQDWFGGDWPKPSKVTFTLDEEGSQTTLILLHEDVPDDEVDSFDEGWKEYYLGPMKELLEAGE
ncbi:MAG: SRPBCC domain-containing protein [Chloroflexi bacterium]|nr:SRPBCC domain-containing protein [Chloroflexota bacterium]